MKYSKDDPGRVKEWEEASAIEGFVKHMKPLCGKPAVIMEIGDDGYTLRPMQVEDMALDWEWRFTDEMLTEL